MPLFIVKEGSCSLLKAACVSWGINQKVDGESAHKKAAVKPLVVDAIRSAI
jgi:hypothetical protein